MNDIDEFKDTIERAREHLSEMTSAPRQALSPTGRSSRPGRTKNPLPRRNRHRSGPAAIEVARPGVSPPGQA